MIIDTSSIFKHWTRPPKKQFPSYMFVYKGFQGDGKSLSMIFDAFRIKKEFPDCVIFSNTYLFGIDYNFFSTVGELMDALRFKNGENGVLILIDEAQNWFNKKSGVPIDVMRQFCGNRKNRRCIMMTTQIWDDLDVPVRKQVYKVVSCNCYAKKWQFNKVSNGYKLKYDKQENEYIAPKLYSVFFKHCDEYYNRYDTFETINTNKEIDTSLTMSAGRASPTPSTTINIRRK